MGTLVDPGSGAYKPIIIFPFLPHLNIAVPLTHHPSHLDRFRFFPRPVLRVST